MNKIYGLSSVILVASLMGCGSSSDTPKTVAEGIRTSTATDPSLAGKWNSSCTAIGDSNNSYVVYSLAFASNQIAIQGHISSQSDCYEELAAFTGLAYYRMGDSVTTTAGIDVKQLDIYIDNIDGVKAGNWSIDDKKLLKTIGFDATVQTQDPGVFYQIYLPESDALNLGEATPSNNALTPETRAVEIDLTTNDFTKAN